MDTTHNPDPAEVFTTAVRAVIAEMEIDNLPIPMLITPTDNGIQIQVDYDKFEVWQHTLAGPSEIEVRSPAHDTGYGYWAEHLIVRGTINNQNVSVVTVHKLETPAVA